MVGGAKVIIDSTIATDSFRLLNTLIENYWGGAMAPWPSLSYAYIILKDISY